MKEYEIEIKGITPYLMNRFVGDLMAKAPTYLIGTKDYASEITNALYQSPKGEIYVPGEQIKGTLVEAGKQMRVVGKGKATYSKIFGAFLVITPDTIPMTNQKWIEDARAVVIQKSRVMRYRPKFMDWGLKFTITTLTDNISAEVLKEGLELAGNFSGIGDFRPQKKGSFGRFMVTSFKEVK